MLPHPPNPNAAPVLDKDPGPTRRIRTLLILCGLVLALISIGSVSGCRRQSKKGGPPLVVTSFFPLYDFARAIAGTNAEVRCLVPPGGDPHHSEANPGMVRWVEDADAILVMGLGMDGWVEKLGRGERPHRLVQTATGINTRKSGPTMLAGHSDAASDPDEVDPHVWLDPLLAVRMVDNITQGLMAKVPGAAESMRSRAELLKQELVALHRDFESGLSQVPRRQVVTFHGAYGYLFARYQLETAGVIEPFPGDEPSAGYLRDLVDLMRKLKLRTIFAEPQLPGRPAEVIAREIGGTVERLDPCETILPEAPGRTYLERQRQNLATLRRVLATP